MGSVLALHPASSTPYLKSTMRSVGFVFGLILILTVPMHAAAQTAAPAPPAPPPPDRYFATIRYRILTLRDLHVAQYDALIAHLQGSNSSLFRPWRTFPRPTARIGPRTCLPGWCRAATPSDLGKSVTWPASCSCRELFRCPMIRSSKSMSAWS